jgi:methyl-accepting chemotaxis protein
VPARRTVYVNLDVGTGGARKDIRATKDDLGKLKAAAAATGKSLDELAAEAKVAGRQLDDLADEARQADHQLDDLAAGADKAGRATDKLGTKVRISGRNLRDMKGELGRLDRQIDETVAHLKLLEHQFATTGDKSLLKQISSDRSLISRLKQIRKDLTPSAAPDFADLISGAPFKVGSIAAIAAVASVLAAPIGAAVAGAVIGGVGLGGIVGGVIAAAQDGRVKDAFKPIGAGLADSLQEAGRPFLGPLLHEANNIALAAYRGINLMRKGFTELAPVLRPLVRGVDGFIEALGPGLSDAFRAARPAIRALADELPQIGAALSDLFSTISEDDRATEGLIGLLHATEELTTATGFFIGQLEYEFDWLVKIGTQLDELQNNRLLGNIMSTFGFGFEYFTDQATDVSTSLDKAKDSSNDFAQSLDGTADSADQAAQKVKELQDKIDDLFAAQMSWDEAQIRLRDGMRDLIKELTTGKRTLSEHTAEGDKNRQAILDQIQTILNASKAYATWSGDIAGANRKRDEELEGLRTLLIKLGYNKQLVNELVDAYKKIPAKASAAVEAPGLAAVQSRLTKVNSMLDRIDGRVARATILLNQETHREDARAYRRWGGITEHAQTGLLRDPAIFSPAGPARYAFAEPATGGEAFVPKNGDYGRSMSILSQAASWYGASVVRGSQSAAPVIQVNVTAGAGSGQLAQALISTLRTEIKYLGGNVQSAIGSR